jgi:hypothetical protein
MKPIKAIGVKEADKPFRINNPHVFRKLLQSLPVGKYWLSVDKYHKKASSNQYSWLYGSVYPLSLVALNDAGYDFTNIEQVNNFWMGLFASNEMLNRETGEIMKLPMSKSEFSTVDQMAYCNQIMDYCSEYLGAFIPEPDVHWKELKTTE